MSSTRTGSPWAAAGAARGRSLPSGESLRPPEIRNLSEKYFLKVASSVCAPKCAYHSNSAGQHSQDSSSNVFDISTGDEDNGDTSPHKWDKVSDVIYPQYVCMCVCFVCVYVCACLSMCVCVCVCVCLCVNVYVFDDG